MHDDDEKVGNASHCDANSAVACGRLMQHFRGTTDTMDDNASLTVVGKVPWQAVGAQRLHSKRMSALYQCFGKCNMGRSEREFINVLDLQLSIVKGDLPKYCMAGGK